MILIVIFTSETLLENYSALIPNTFNNKTEINLSRTFITFIIIAHLCRCDLLEELQSELVNICHVSPESCLIG